MLGFKAVSNRASFFGQFVREILGGSVKLDAVILISHKALFGYALCKALWGFKAVSNRASFFGQFVREILGGSVKLDAVILISHKALFGYALCKALWNALQGLQGRLKPSLVLRQFVREILGGSVKLDAVILISHKSLFGYALCKAL
ncbi:hypothetical protein AAC387_Pa07g1951 [Persea americana]